MLRFLNILFAAWVLALIAASLILIGPADASLCYVSEYASIPLANHSNVDVAQQASLDQTPVNFGGGATQSAAFGSRTSYVRMWCDVQCSILFGTNPTATNANTPLAATTPEYFFVPAGQGWKVSCIANP